ncbi:hypothetical protein [Howardella ureilytica]
MNENDFLQIIDECLLLSASNNNTLTKEQIAEVFDDFTPTEDNLKNIYNYLISKGVVIEGYVPEFNIYVDKSDSEGGNAEDEDEIYNYINEIKRISDIKREDMSDVLMQSVIDKDEDATKELFDYVLSNIIDMVSDFADSEYLMDYVQECNVAAASYILGREFINESREANISKFGTNEILNMVDEIVNETRELSQKALRALAHEDESTKKAADTILKKVNYVNDGAANYKEEYALEPTPEELAKYLNLSVDEILDTVKNSGYKIDGINYEKNDQ